MASLVIVKLSPVLVGVVRAGFEVNDLASDTWNKAKVEVNQVKADAKGTRTDASSAAVADLQAQVQALKAQLAVKKA